MSAPGPRLVARRQCDGTWGVYDRAVASWPRQVPGVGDVAQNLRTERAAQTEADRVAAARPDLATVLAQAAAGARR